MMSTARDYYEILGLSKGSSLAEIKKAYRQLAMKYHPDRVASEQKKESEEKFKEISEAYAVLSDPQKKQLYDQYGHAGIDSRYSTEDIFRNADFSSIFGGAGGFSDVFEQIFSNSGFDIFGGRSTQRRAQKSGEDIQMQVSITLEEASFGTETDVALLRYSRCQDCQGSGVSKGSTKVTCSTCKGSGSVRSGLGGFISFAQTCPACGGQGQVIKNPCKSCSGNGRIRKRKNLKVTIPQGVDSGSALRLKNEGHFAPGGRGDLYIYIEVKPHAIFKREGDDIRCTVKIDVVEAILGAEIEVPTLTGKAKMKIPSGTQPSTVFRLKNKGVVNLRTKRLGDEFIEVNVDIPKKLSSREKRLMEEWTKLRK